MIALLLRIPDLGAFLSVDEIISWIPRSERFLRALQQQDYGATAISGHPGVTTMWSGSMGLLLRTFLFEQGILREEFMTTVLTLYRLPIVVGHGVGILVGYAMLRRLFPAMIAFLAAMLWATDPFIVAFNRILHVDGLAGTFATLSVLAACCYWNHNQQRKWLYVSGICAGLAIMSKLPALVLLPLVGMLAFFLAIEQRKSDHPVRVLLNQGGALLLWGGAVIVALLIFWPAVWAAPQRVIKEIHDGIAIGETPHAMGNFFLGKPDDVPGPLFYPVALVMRTTPWVFGGLLFLPWAIRHLHRHHASRDIAVLIGFVILFIAAMTLFPKKFNRYLIPCFPSLVIVAAAGLGSFIEFLTRWESWPRWGREKITPMFLSFISLIAILHGYGWHTYGVAYFNELFGGARAGPKVFVVGWGEGYDQIANYLNQQPDITDVLTLSRWGPLLNPFLKKGAFANGADDGLLPEEAGYVVVYLRYVLDGQADPPFDQFYPHRVPIHTVTLHGVDYAWIYDVPRPMDHALETDFGSLLYLNGYSLDTSAIESSQVLTLSMQFQARAPINKNYLFFAYVLNSKGERVAQIDVNPAGPHMPTTRWEPGFYHFWSHPIPLPSHLPPGPYWIACGMYDPQNFSRLPISSPQYPNAISDLLRNAAGPNAHILAPFTIRR